MRADSATAMADGKPFQHHWRPQFHRFRIGEARIGHVHVNGIGSGSSADGTGATAQRLKDAEILARNHHVVHGSLACGSNSKRSQYCINHTLTCLCVASKDRRAAGWVCMEFRVEQSARNHQLHRLQKSLVEWRAVLIKCFVHARQDAQGIEDCAANNGDWRVQISGVNASGAGEINAQSIGGAINPHADWRAIIKEFRARNPGSGNARGHGAGAGGAPREQCVDGRSQRIATDRACQSAERSGAGIQCGDRSAHVVTIEIRIARRVGRCCQRMA